MSDRIKPSDKVEFISKTAMDLGYISLSNKCGTYYRLMYDGDKVYVLRMVGLSGVEFIELDTLPKVVIGKIYNDLHNNFN